MKYFDYPVASAKYTKNAWTAIAIPLQSIETKTSNRIAASVVQGESGFIGYFSISLTGGTTVYLFNHNTSYDLTTAISIRIFYRNAK